jgi:hypothetical protein
LAIFREESYGMAAKRAFTRVVLVFGV